jgi:hypothetical protein
MVARKSTNIHPSEHQEQAGFIHWFRHQFPRVLIFAVPNGEHRSISVAKRLKAEGVVRGIPDLCIPAWNLWVEMKRIEGGRLSKEQREMIRYLESIGHTVIVGRGAKDASRQVLQFIKKDIDEVQENN